MRSLLLAVVMLPTFVFGQLDLNFETGNESGKLSDGWAYAKVTGGKPPYSYYWSQSSTSLEADTSKGLTEGKEYVLSLIHI